MDTPVPLQSFNIQSSSPSPALTGKFRRNGKLQSCEPCRKSKLRCDHTVPTCGRCIKRRCPDQCVYHPNPLTQIRHATSKRPLPTPSTSTNHTSPASSLPSIETSHAESSSNVHTADPVCDTTAQQPQRAASAPPPLRTEPEFVGRRSTGFLGVTSYTSIFSENLGSLGVVAADLETSEVKKIHIPVDRIVRGCHVLSLLKDRLMINRFITKWYETCGGSGFIIIEPIMKQWLFKFRLQFSDILTEQNPLKVRQLCELLWRNTQTPLVVNGNTTAKEWISQGTGMNIRWEVIGCVATIVGLCANTFDPSDPLFREHNVNRCTLSVQMSEVAQTCVSFCRECDALDDMFLWLLIKNEALTCSIKGDGSYSAYQERGEIVSAVISMGLHQEIKANDRTPLFLAQLRKRAFIIIYSHEVGMAAYLGRPPRLTYRYSVLDPPLDLSDKQLVLDRPELDAVIAQLDQKGYNAAGKFTRGAFMRSWIGFVPRREDVLDLALGNYTSDEIIQRAEVIQAKTEEQWDQLPEFIRKTRQEVLNVTQTPMTLELLFKASIRQGTRANEFLRQRVLMRKANASPEKLIQTAQAIFKEVLLMGQRHDLASNYSMDLTSILVIHGLRCAAIIAVELLKQEQLPVYPKNPLLPRSQTIQDLSVFAARLGAIDPTDGMYNVCEQGHKVITRILDKILTPAPAERYPTSSHDVNANQDQQTQGELGHMMDVDIVRGEAVRPTTPQRDGSNAPEIPLTTMGMGSDVNFGFDGPFAPLGNDNDFMFMQWLENMDWERSSPWMGLHQYH